MPTVRDWWVLAAAIGMGALGLAALVWLLGVVLGVGIEFALTLIRS